MSINFFDASCQETPRRDAEFGLCDNEDGTKAYTDTNNSPTWIAIVKNISQKEIVFTAIDKCVIKDGEQQGRGRCDGMLTSADHLYFVELKNQSRGWITDALNQLESTIIFFTSIYDINSFKHKKAFACNKKHQHFQVIDNEANIRFFRKYGFRIDVQAEIIVI